MYDVGNGISVDFQQELSNGHAVYSGLLEGEEVAVKLVTPGKSNWNRVEREVKNMINLATHKNTVQYKVSSLSTRPPTLYIAMEKCRSGTLEEAIRRNALAKDDRKVVLQHIIHGLMHIHEKEVLHTMLEPRHILLSSDGKHAKISGFGLSRAPGKTASSISKRVIGEWSSPEVLLEKELDEKADIFSAGLIFHQTISGGKHPFGGDSSSRKYNIQKGVSMEIDLNDDRHPSIAAHIVKAMLSGDKKFRPTAREVLEHPYFWTEDRLKGCKDIVSKYYQKVADLQALFPTYPVRNALEGSAMLYAITFWKERKTDSIELKEELETELKEMIRPFPKYTELKNVHFRPDELTRCSGIELPPEEPSSDEETGSSSSLIGDEVIVDIKACIIYVQQELRPETKVFPVDMKDAIQHKAVVKLMLKTDKTQNCVSLWLDANHENMVTLKRAIDFKAEKTHQMFENGATYLCVVMEKCSETLSQLKSRSPSSHYRKMLALHLVHVINFLHSEKRIAHNRISEDKVMLSKDKRHLNLLWTRETTQGENPSAFRRDIKQLAELVEAIMGVEDTDADILDRELLKNLSDGLRRDKTAYQALRHPYFWSAAKKLEFLSKVSEKFDARENNSKMEDYLSGCSEENWTGVLKLRDGEEKEKWFSYDDDGLVYQKAVEMKNTSTPKYKPTSSVWLIRFIRNCSNHLLEDCEKEGRDNDYKTRQTLFRSKDDIWNFFASRYPQLLCRVYNYIRDESGLRKTQGFKRFFEEEAVKIALNKVDKPKRSQ